MRGLLLELGDLLLKKPDAVVHLGETFLVEALDLLKLLSAAEQVFLKPSFGFFKTDALPLHLELELVKLVSG